MNLRNECCCVIIGAKVCNIFKNIDFTNTVEEAINNINYITVKINCLVKMV